LVQNLRAHSPIWLFIAYSLLSPPPRAVAQSVDAQQESLRGLTSLHEFEYEEANDAFKRAQSIDAGLVMAFWGEAMTYHQTLWRHENVDAARQALLRLGPTRSARARKCRTPKERDLLEAVEVLFGPGAAADRRRHYADAMARVHERHADDPDIAALYALALLGTMSRSLIGSEDVHEGHNRALAGSETQVRVAAILESVLKSHPDHRGALHYLLHDYDDPEHARLALSAARAYAKIGSESSHALHMPSHIFLQLGMWHDAEASDRAAFAASERSVAKKSLGSAMRNYHALSWLQYELLQLGRYREAQQTIRELEPVVTASGQATLLSDLSSMRARYVIETRRWNLMAGEQNFGNVNDLFAIGMSAVRVGNAGVAERARKALADRAQAKEEGDLRPAIAVMERELAGLIAVAAGRSHEAVSILQAAAHAELDLPAPLGLPIPIKPAPELLGEVLLDLRRPNDAIEWFARALRRNANRTLSVIGLARASALVGHADTADLRYREALANFEHADSDVPELTELRAAVEEKKPETRRPAKTALLISFLITVSIAVVLVIRRRARREKKRPALAGRAGRSTRRKS